jgi:hypothetical protein
MQKCKVHFLQATFLLCSSGVAGNTPKIRSGRLLLAIYAIIIALLLKVSIRAGNGIRHTIVVTIPQGPEATNKCVGCDRQQFYRNRTTYYSNV